MLCFIVVEKKEGKTTVVSRNSYNILYYLFPKLIICCKMLVTAIYDLTTIMLFAVKQKIIFVILFVVVQLENMFTNPLKTT